MLPAPIAVTWEDSTTSSSLDSAGVSSTNVSFPEGTGPMEKYRYPVGSLRHAPCQLGRAGQGRDFSGEGDAPAMAGPRLPLPSVVTGVIGDA